MHVQPFREIACTGSVRPPDEDGSLVCIAFLVTGKVEPQVSKGTLPQLLGSEQSSDC